ncbi:MAG: hypothetical protein E7620_04735 [Ruminococcaceae bacterium]|nr:hypothetical protein [Oscillospiraceae bacterium]
MINNTAIGEAVKLPSSIGEVWAPMEGWSYSHHAHITFFKGRFFAAWSNGRVNEDDLGQRVMLAESADGLQWEKHRPIVTPELLGDPTRVLTAAGFHTHEGRLYLYYGSYNYEQESLQDANTRPKGDTRHKNTDLGYLSTKDGDSWTPPQSLGLAVIANHGPQPTSSGRLIISGNISFPYTDDPCGASGYRMTGIYGDAFGENPPVDDSESIHHVTAHNGWDARLICEGSFYQTDDGVLHMLLRSNSGRLWVTESRNNGETWSSPTPTNYTDDGSKFHLGRLPDGRFYCVSNAKVKGGRCPLDLYLSQNGEDFNRHYVLRDEPYEIRFEGMYKGGIYGYPHSLIHNGYLYVIYSKRKEAVEVTRVELRML